MALTKQDIWRCADELDAEGIRPTLAAVRKKLGSGSYTTISEAMAEWKNRKQASTLPAQEPLPAAFSEQLAETGNALWAIALAHANARFDEDRKHIEADKEAMQQQLAEAIELADTFTRENDQLRERVNQLEPMERERDKLADQLAEVKRRSGEELNRCMEKLTQRDNEAIEARKQAKEAIERAASLQGQVEALKEQVANLTAVLKTGGKQ
ncbi:DNA-binding protein [Pseudochrobactrum sp. B5]|uniref:DNA-binding protein n=1 Tax=Pseudochrobactrum sp. B5 TaxID=1289478 RepID=UPI0009521D3D|nr:DNA-binding protein [Pseudochrobactrum sp. B5]